MTAFLLRHWRVLLAAAAALFVIAFITYEVRRHDREVAERARLQLIISQDSAKLAHLQAGYSAIETKLLQTQANAAHATASFDVQRREGVSVIHTRPLPRDSGRMTLNESVVVPANELPTGTRDSLIVVTPQFLAAADTAVKQCKLLQADCAALRIRADSLNAAQAEMIRHLQAAGTQTKRAGGHVELIVGALVLGVLTGHYVW